MKDNKKIELHTPVRKAIDMLRRLHMNVLKRNLPMEAKIASDLQTKFFLCVWWEGEKDLNLTLGHASHRFSH